MTGSNFGGYGSFVSKNSSFLAYGLSLTFASNCGQTFFISLFGGHLRETLEVTDGDLGFIYSAATLTSAGLLPFVGRLIDRIDLRLYSIAVCIGLVAGCFVMASVTNTVTLFIGYLLLRQFGQGLLGHTAGTSMSRYFEAERGKAMSLVALGYPLGEAIFPTVIVASMVAIGWRTTWVVTGAAVAIILIPVVFWLLRHHGVRHRRLEEQLSAAARDGRTVSGWTRGEVLQHWSFYLVIPAVLCPPFIGTGVFFHQVRLCEIKNWPLEFFATSFVAYAIATIVTSLYTGTLVDRLGGRRLVAFYLVPQSAALLVLAFFDHELACYGFMIGAGITAGASSPIIGALWAEMYGIANLGAIRSLVYGVMVFATACAPGPLGWLLDEGVTVTKLCVVGAVGTFIAGLVAAGGVHRRDRRSSKG